jgi:hypothetical protein
MNQQASVTSPKQPAGHQVNTCVPQPCVFQHRATLGSDAIRRCCSATDVLPTLDVPTSAII